jgi:hypothetical protein
MNPELKRQYDAIVRLLESLNRNDAAVRYAVGQHVQYVMEDEGKYGSNAVQLVATALHRDADTLYDYARVVKAWPRDFSSMVAKHAAHLTFSHYIALAKVPAQRRTVLMRKAVAGGYSVRELKRVAGLVSSADPVDAGDATNQRQFIADARLLMKPGEIKLYKTPTWLSKRLRDWRRSKHMTTMPASMLLTQTAESLITPGQTWLDHWGTSDVGPYSCCFSKLRSDKALNLISEPYTFGSDQSKMLDHFCRELGGLVWHVSSNAWWYPGHTIRVIIHEKKLATQP